MTTTSRHISTQIDRLVSDAYDYASDPRHLPSWAAGLGAAVELVDGQWVCESPMGSVVVKFAPLNQFGVLDHDVTLPSGETVYNPMRVITDGAGCEVIFTLRRRTGVTDEEFESDATAVAADLASLKWVLEAR